MEKIENCAKKFLDAWIGNKSVEINKCVVTKDVEIGARRRFFKEVLLRNYKILSCSELSDESAVLEVEMGLNIRGKIRKKRLLLNAVKIKNDWKIDITSLIVH
jgi:NDP-sugar pyrophosphorylase family protein